LIHNGSKEIILEGRKKQLKETRLNRHNSKDNISLKKQLTFNVESTYHRNYTQAFVDALMQADNHEQIMRKAQEVDSSGLEAKRRKEQVKPSNTIYVFQDYGGDTNLPKIKKDRGNKEILL
jgi:3-deoxy-D-arabino-heptulosonate 7-phosphate (DAHP) synthase